MTQQIQIQNASLKFRIYRNRAPALKEAVIGLLTGKRDKDAVTEFDALKKINLTIRGSKSSRALRSPLPDKSLFTGVLAACWKSAQVSP
ncbi:MAG: hypothetical protein HYX67_03735 [Candidatus Melainabacteria bacterium]|nr:hypothetical protein [Candidatus Melainabacteria bacterium]